MSLRVIWLAFLVIVTPVLWLARKWIAHRARLTDLPKPPFSSFWGHLILMGEMRDEYPLDVHPHTYPALVREKYKLGPVFYLDFWPAAPCSMVIADPELAKALLVAPKHEQLHDFMNWIAGPKNLVTMDGKEWRTWRNIFNPGFSGAHLMTLVPIILEEGRIFCRILEEHAAKKDVFRMEELLTRLTVDIIARVTLDTTFGTQRGENELLNLLKKQIASVGLDQSLNPFVRLSPLRQWRQKRYSKQMDDYVIRVLRARHQERVLCGTNEKADAKRKSIVDLALETYFAETENKQANGYNKSKLDPIFEKYAAAQIRAFLFAGHDTTSSAICYAMYMLSTHPEDHAKVLAEHDAVFGQDPVEAVSKIKDNPHLLNKLEFTTAVIKEVLRMYPAASAIKKGSKDIFIRDPVSGKMLPTDGFMVWIVHSAIHRDPAMFPDPHTFRPSRFLSPELSTQPEGAWRPFERGPRNCIGQELAMLEIKIILVIVMRRFDMHAAFDKIDQVADDGQGWPKHGEANKGGKEEVWGEIAYQSWRG